MKRKILSITQEDYMLANRKAAREIEILAHGKQIMFRSFKHKSPKTYDRKSYKKKTKELILRSFAGDL